MNPDEKLNNLMTYAFCCATCYKGFQTEPELREHIKTHPSVRGISERLFFFAKKDGSNTVVPYDDKNALVWGLGNPAAFEYLGMIETDDASILDKNADEIRAMNLPRIRPQDNRSTLTSRRGTIVTGERLI